MSVTRTYMCQTHGVVFETEQRITEGPLTSCHHCAVPKCVPKRLINVEGDVHFISGDSGGWSNTGYSKRPHERRAEHRLGRKLIKSEK
jgi:predicted nucleic acid-binding Zn ribbon protein